VADEPAASAKPTPHGNGGRRGGAGGARKAVGDGPREVEGTDFAALRRLLVGPEQNRLEELATELRERHVSAADMAEHLPEAIMLRGKRDRQIGRALAPTVETALRESIRRNPREIATAIFPILGPAIRKAIAETMSALVRSINSAVEHSFSPRGIKWRIESWRTGVPYAQVLLKHALVYRVEQVFLIHAESGLLLAHATPPGVQVPDADLISGMLTAIQDFVRDSFRPGEGATLRTFSVGDHTVQVEAGPLALLALVIKGEAPEEVRRKQQDTLETIHLQFAGALADFDGDAAQFESVHPLLEESLETVVDTGTRGRGRLIWLRWALPAAVVGAVLVFLAARSTTRFKRAVAALNDEPGLVVLDADRSWRSWQISGLRDPQARRPEAVIASAGLVPRAVVGRWEPYLSLDSGIVVSRARHLWAVPAGTQLSLHADTLTVSGELPLASLGMMHRASLPPGVAEVVLDQPRITLPAHLDSTLSALIADRVLFAPGQSESTGNERLRLRDAASRFRSFEDSVGARGALVELRLVGRTDPTGTDETNQALAQWRVDHVAAIFASAGVRTERLRGEAVATARPLPAADSAQQARINRSVSFEIGVTARPRVPRER
jgi:outer membrane protein OmpA-like peptidoglycan-associated protein